MTSKQLLLPFEPPSKVKQGLLPASSVELLLEAVEQKPKGINIK